MLKRVGDSGFPSTAPKPLPIEILSHSLHQESGILEVHLRLPELKPGETVHEEILGRKHTESELPDLELDRELGLEQSARELEKQLVNGMNPVAPRAFEAGVEECLLERRAGGAHEVEVPAHIGARGVHLDGGSADEDGHFEPL
jgi:hypothetical protein